VAQKETRDEQEKSPLFSVFPADFVSIGANYLGACANVQNELFGEWQEINQRWFSRLSAEANLGSELASHLTSVRSVPDAMTACQEWSSRRFQMMAEDSQHLLADAQKLAETSTRVFSNGWQSKKPSVKI